MFVPFKSDPFRLCTPTQYQSTPINWWFSPRAFLLCSGWFSTHGHPLQQPPWPPHKHGKLHLGRASAAFLEPSSCGARSTCFERNSNHRSLFLWSERGQPFWRSLCASIRVWPSQNVRVITPEHPIFGPSQSIRILLWTAVPFFFLGCMSGLILLARRICFR